MVTGEAVALDLRLARLPSRALALLLDVGLQLAALLGLVYAAGRILNDADAALAATVQLTITVAVLVGYPVLVETLWRGRTVGKAVLGLRVVRDDGGPIRFRQALVRGLLAFFVDIWLTVGVGAIVASVLSARGKRLGDVLAGTVVIRERAPAAAVAAPGMPPQLAAWAAAADLSRVGDELALASRQLLGRRRQLTGAAYAGLSHHLADAVAAVVTPLPPPGTPTDAYLAAVLAERRRREELRLRPAPAPVAHPGPAHAPDPSPPASAGGFALPG